MIEHSFTVVMRTKLATTKMTTTTKISLEQLQSKANKNKETPSKMIKQNLKKYINKIKIPETKQKGKSTTDTKKNSISKSQKIGVKQKFKSIDIKTKRQGRRNKGLSKMWNTVKKNLTQTPKVIIF